MLITAANIGDVIRMDHNASHIRIETVKDGLVHYINESGDRYATREHEIAGSVVRDQKRLQEFSFNAVLGAALGRTELSAHRKTLDGAAPEQDRREADSVLQSARQMRSHLDRRLTQRDMISRPSNKSRGSLDAMISKAAAESGSKKPSHHEHSVPKERE